MIKALYYFWLVVGKVFGGVAYVTGAMADFANRRAAPQERTKTPSPGGKPPPIPPKT